MREKNKNSLTEKTTGIDVANLVSAGTFKDEKKPAIKDDVFKELMDHLNQMEQLRKYYNKLKVKRDTLAEALKSMEAHPTKNAKFEEDENTPFEFDILIREKNVQPSKQELFVINQPETVTSFTKHLLTEINELLDVFESDIVEHSKKLKP